MKRLVKKLLYTLGIAVICGGLQAQSLDQAKKLYNDGKFAEAKPAFEKLIKQAPSNSSYNHWYGVCCYETGDLISAEKYLRIAVKRRVQEAYRYMGDLCFRTYRFEEAAEMYDEYIALLEKKKQNTELYDAKLDLTEKALRMMEKTENIQIIDSIVVDKNNLLSAYTLSEESGNLVRYGDFFETNQPISSTVYTNQKGDKIHYAHPAEDNLYCLFSQSKLMDKWGDEKQLPMNVNSNKNDNYPFVLSDGVTIYYASEGNGALGGYDLFVTRYNTNSDNYLAPEQLGMPFNSPANDYMLVIDESKGLGWFASDRNQPEGKVCVYLFIPDDSHKRVEGEDMVVKRARASITAIKDSWVADANYANLIALSHKEIPYGKVEIKKDFEFVINNNVVYYTLKEIKSPEARNYYEKVIYLNKQIQQVNDQLVALRTSYVAGNKAKRDQLSPAILKAEEQLNSLLYQPDEQEKKARNAEINYLRNQK
ncbi:MAG: tetratricopeptide repeat protein [Tannerellaceae bacterium]